MKSYDLNLLSALDALLATGSVTAAAERMHLSTPAMSHTLARIRETVGDPLLVRAGRKLVPTPRALALAEPVRRLLADAQALLQPPTLHSLAAQPRRFVVRAPDGIAVVFGAALAQRLQQDLPLASLQFVPEGHTDPGALREGRIDLDVGQFSGGDPETEVLQLSQQPLVGAVRRGHPLLSGRLNVRRFAAERHVVVSSRPGEASALDAALAGRGLARFVVMTVPNGYTALTVAAHTELVATVGERVALGMRESLPIEVFTLPLAVATEPMLMAWHPRHSADPAHQWLRHCVQQLLAGYTRLNVVSPPGGKPMPTAQRPAAPGMEGGAKKFTPRHGTKRR